MQTQDNSVKYHNELIKLIINKLVIRRRKKDMIRDKKIKNDCLFEQLDRKEGHFKQIIQAGKIISIHRLIKISSFITLLIFS